MYVRGVTDLKLRVRSCGNRESYMSAHVLLTLLNELGKGGKMRGLSSILSLLFFCNEFNKFNNTEHSCNTPKHFGWKKCLSSTALKIRNYLANVHKIDGAHVQYMNKHYAKFEY